MVRKFIFLILVILLSSSAFGFRAAMVPAGFDRYSSERGNIAFLDGNNNFTGNNTMDYLTVYNFTVYNYTGVNLVNGTDFWDGLDDPSDINAGDITDDGTYLTSESDPVYSGWDKSTGISITESQISDLVHTINCTIDGSCSPITYDSEFDNDSIVRNDTANDYDIIVTNLTIRSAGNDDFSVYHDEYGYPGFFGSYGDFFLGVNGDATAYLNYYNGDSFIIGEASNPQVVSIIGTLDVSSDITQNSVSVCLEDGVNCNIVYADLNSLNNYTLAEISVNIGNWSQDMDSLPNLTLDEIASNIGNWSAEDNTTILRNDTDNDYKIYADSLNVGGNITENGTNLEDKYEAKHTAGSTIFRFDGGMFMIKIT